MDVTVKQAKTVPALELSVVVLGLGGLLVLMGFIINVLVKSYSTNDLTDVSLWWFSLFVVLFIVALAVAAVIEVSVSIVETYIFTNDRLIKKHKKKVKFEIPYSNIETFEIDKLFIIKDWAMSIHSTEPFVKYGMNKFLKRVDGYFKKSDLEKVKEKIIAYNAENGNSVKIIEKVNFLD